jgi:Helix-turn-helix domain
MSQKEYQRVKVIENAVDGRLRVGEAARLLQLSERQVQRLKRGYRSDSIAWVHHGNRGRPMPWALPAALRQTVLRLARGKYAGFNDSLRETPQRRASVGQPRNRAPQLAPSPSGFPAEASCPPVSRPPLCVVPASA